MVIYGLKEEWFSIANVGLNLGTSPYALKPGEATRILNIDHTEETRALVGRWGTGTLGGATGGLTNPALDLFRGRKDGATAYYMATYNDGSNQKLAAYKTNAFNDLKLVDTSDFNMTADRRVYMVNADGLVWGSGKGSGDDNMFYWDFTEWNGITTFTTLKKYHFFEHWDGRMWGWTGLSAELHHSDTDDYKLWVGSASTGNYGFLLCGQNNDPVRACVPARDRMWVFKTNEIGYIFNTGNPAAPYAYKQSIKGSGTISQGTLHQWHGDVIFLDKDAPYLFVWTGNQVIPLDPEEKLSKVIPIWFDVADFANIRMEVYGNNILITFKTRSTSDGGGARWVAAIAANQKNERGERTFPWGFWDISCNDILVADEGTDIGRCLFADDTAYDSKGWVRRIGEEYSVEYGDEGDPTEDPATTTYEMWTGYLGDDKTLKRFVTFDIRAEWDGTPAVSDTIQVEYRLDGWTNFETLLISSAQGFKPIPFPSIAVGRKIQLKFKVVTKTFRPHFHGFMLGWQELAYKGP